MTAADYSLRYLPFFLSEKIRLDILCESSAWQRIHMKHQALFSSKDIGEPFKRQTKIAAENILIFLLLSLEEN